MEVELTYLSVFFHLKAVEWALVLGFEIKKAKANSELVIRR
jgi:hypothetical protein